MVSKEKLMSLVSSWQNKEKESFPLVNPDAFYSVQEIYKTITDKKDPHYGKETLANVFHFIDAEFDVGNNQKATVHFHLFGDRDKTIYGLRFPHNPFTETTDIERAELLANFPLYIKNNLGSPEIHVPDTHRHLFNPKILPVVNDVMLQALLKKGFRHDFHYGQYKLV